MSILRQLCRYKPRKAGPKTKGVIELSPKKQRAPQRDNCRHELRALARRDKRLQAQRKALQAERIDAIERAQDAGLSLVEIAQLLERNRSGLYVELTSK